MPPTSLKSQSLPGVQKRVQHNNSFGSKVASRKKKKKNPPAKKRTAERTAVSTHKQKRVGASVRNRRTSELRRRPLTLVHHHLLLVRISHLPVVVLPGALDRARGNRLQCCFFSNLLALWVYEMKTWSSPERGFSGSWSRRGSWSCPPRRCWLPGRPGSSSPGPADPWAGTRSGWVCWRSSSPDSTCTPGGPPTRTTTP